LIQQRALFLPAFLLLCVAGFALLPWLGQDFFPSTDTGQFKLHLRAKSGTRIEETARLCDLVEDTIRRVIPKEELVTVLAIIALPSSGLQLTYSTAAPIGRAHAAIYVSLANDHRPTDDYLRRLRRTLPQEFPGSSFSFLPADTVSQILNFGAPSSLDIQID